MDPRQFLLPFSSNDGYPNNFYTDPMWPTYQALILMVEQKNNEINFLKKENSDLRVAYQRKSQQNYQRECSCESQKKNQAKTTVSKKNYYRSKLRHGQDRFRCPYGNCEGVYGSTLALNFHIKKKHDGGNKKERQAYAKIIVKAEERGEQPPVINFNFPPGYLEEYRKIYEHNKQKFQNQQKGNGQQDMELGSSTCKLPAQERE